MDNILPNIFLSHKDIMLDIAHRMRRLRLDHFNWSRAYLAEKSGVTESTIKRFEKTGQITLENLVLLAMALESLEGLGQLFPMPEIDSIAELEKREQRRQRGRGGK